MDAAALKSIPLFSHLSHKELDLVARHADEVDVETGHLLTRQGGLALEFFVVEEGTATVEKDGKEINKLGPGDFFGEIGLLRHQPRTATVRADGPMKLIVMFGPEFSAVESDIAELDASLRKSVDARLAQD
ncbi:MAG: cyclic nucleotide-binding domain-containing protein [Actinomycetota bacterium]